MVYVVWFVVSVSPYEEFNEKLKNKRDVLKANWLSNSDRNF